jgi:hypothetical protein
MTYSGMSHIHVDVGQHFVALANPSDAGGATPPRVRSRESTRNTEYAARAYSRDVPEYRRRASMRDLPDYASNYEPASRRYSYDRYADDDDGYDDGYGYGGRGGYESRMSAGAQYASGYATIYN